MRTINENTFYILFVSSTSNEYAIKEIPVNELNEDRYVHAPNFGKWVIYGEGKGQFGWDIIQGWLSRNMALFI